MRISYAITVCDEEDEIVRLIDFLLKNKRYEDEICVLLDKPKATKHIQKSLWNYSTNKEISIDEFMSRANEIDWSMHSPLWNNIFVLLGTKILTKEENYGQSTKLVKYLIGGKQAHGDIAFMTSLKAVWNQQRPDEQLPKPLY